MSTSACSYSSCCANGSILEQANRVVGCDGHPVWEQASVSDAGSNYGFILYDWSFYSRCAPSLQLEKSWIIDIVLAGWFAFEATFSTRGKS